jgi:hypothetical protein
LKKKQKNNIVVNKNNTNSNNGWSDSKLAIIGYTLGGSCVGYILHVVSFSTTPKWIIFGGLSGLSVGLIKTYKKPIIETTTTQEGQIVKSHKSNNTSIGSAIKFVGGGFLIYYLAIPILLFGGGVLLAGKVRERRYY